MKKEDVRINEKLKNLMNDGCPICYDPISAVNGFNFFTCMYC